MMEFRLLAYHSNIHFYFSFSVMITRRQRLKNSTAVRRDEFELEGKCISAVEEISADLRSAIDQLWVKEHLKERRIYEAAEGRMERLEKSALIIWNKHSHMAIDQREEYDEWLAMYRKERDMKISERRAQIDREWRNWRSEFGFYAKKFAKLVRFPIRRFVEKSFTYDVDVPVIRNLEDLQAMSDGVLNFAIEQISQLRNRISIYLHAEIEKTDTFADERKQALLLDWRDNLFILNSAVNRRIGTLKDMEADLEETIRMTILQHEVENSVFEQLSCARMEQFWLEWRTKMFTLAKELREQQEDYEIAKNSGKSKSRTSRKDRALDDLMIVAKDNSVTLPSIQPSATAQLSSTQGSLLKAGPVTTSAIQEEKTDEPAADHHPHDHTPTDTMRLKRILDDIRPEIYREFTHKLTRGLEKVRRDLGEGRRRIVPPYAVAKCLISACDFFYERARLSERCVGRVSSKGHLLFADGLPVHARSLFNIASTLYVISELTLKEDQMYLDCDDVFELMHNVKQVFMIGLLTVTLQLGEFGEYFLNSESMWACSVLEVDPPVELLYKLDAKGLDQVMLEKMQPTGFYSEDPVDLMNSLLDLTTEVIEVQQLQEKYTLEVENQHREQLAAIHAAELHRAARVEVETPQQHHIDHDDHSDALSESIVFQPNGHYDDKSSVYGETPSVYGKSSSVKAATGTFPGHVLESSVVTGGAGSQQLPEQSLATGSLTEENVVIGYKNESQKLYGALQRKMPYKSRLASLASLLPGSDIIILAAMLGRPDGSIEITPNRVCQVTSFWRRTALAISTAAFDPPSTEYPRIKDIVAEHTATISGNRRTGYGNIACVSPFEAVSSAIDWVTSIKSLPISLNQALCLISRGGSCDPWLEDPKQTNRGSRIIYELNEFMEMMSSPIPKSMKHQEYLQATFPANIAALLRQLDLNFAGIQPIEMLRTYIQREDVDLSNRQISLIYWTLCRVNEESDDQTMAGTSLHESFKTFQTGGAYRPVIETQFNGDPDAYMAQFRKDVDRYLDSMPTLDTNVILGYLPGPLVPGSAHELVSDAMKLDVSARNAMPPTCCVWLGQRGMELSDALSAVTVDHPQSKEGNILLGVGPRSFHGRRQPAHLSLEEYQRAKFRSDVRTFVEVDLLTKYPELCEVQASNKHYGPAGNEPILSSQGYKNEDHWHELMNRRLSRMDKLSISWRDTMMNEWATSLYQSRQQRYLKRVDIVKQCVGVYHKQYGHLRESIVAERNGLISQFAGIEAELLSLIHEDYNFFSYHSSFLERALRRYEGQLERFITILTDMMREFQRHCGTIKRRAISRVAAASERLRADLEVSCNGLIMGYTAGFAQGYFDELIYRGEVWRNTLTDVQGQLILRKERFMTAKDEIDRDLTIQITDKLTIDRNSYKGHLEALAEDTASMLDIVATTRASYAAVQKDANARLILRIEKAVRESRKLRVAAEQQPELEGPAMRDIRVILDQCKASCLTIVAQIKDTCLTQLHAIEPMRPAHREKMETRVKKLESSWAEVEKALHPLVDDYEKELLKQLSITKTNCMDLIAKYRETESSELKAKYISERKGLIASFRKHFREYDLSEAAIFERFNKEVMDTVEEMNVLWGPSRPKFIAQGMKELAAITEEAMTAGVSDVLSNIHADPRISTANGSTSSSGNDDTTMARMEIIDVFAHSISKCNDFSQQIPV